MPKYIDEQEFNDLLKRVAELEKSSKKPAGIKIQSGVLMTDSENNPMALGKGERNYFWEIKYDEPFDSVPTIHRGITGLEANVAYFHEANIWTEVVEVTKIGFKLRAGTWKKSEIKSLKIDWLAYVEENNAKIR